MKRARPSFRFLVVGCLLWGSCTTSTGPADGTDPSAADQAGTPEAGISDGTDTAQGEVYVDLYDPEKTCDGTTFLPDLHDTQNPRIIEVNMQGDVVWEYAIPDHLKQYHEPGLDVEVLPSGNILFVLPRNGVYEIDRDGTIVWSHLDEKISHDADRLADGNTLYGWGGPDQKTDAQVKEVTPDGEIVWSWYARDHLDTAPYADIYREGWTHTNAVTRLSNGNTLISLRNFNLTVEVNPEGAVVWSYDWSALGGDDPHEPEILPGDHLLVCLQHDTPHQVVEIDRATGEVAWDFYVEGMRTARDSNRLANGNTLVQAVLMPGDESVLMEVTPGREIVWQLKYKDAPAPDSPGWFFKAERVCPE